ncbi:MAG: Gfo/Idh/MocA family oxidoreductase [Chitinophagales bacterium]
MQDNRLNIGIAGAGGFARFAAHAFLAVPGINITGITDIKLSAATAMADSLNSKVFKNYESLLKEESIELIYIATPPYLHYEQSKMALQAGKHVLCEKPAALRSSEAEELMALADAHQLLYTVNLMQRYNPLFAIVRNIVNQKLLGGFLHGYFENYASDESLNADHWFWDEAQSGGIFIEHSVHFFDLFEGWLGAGKVTHALQLNRPGITKPIVDRVQVTVLYKDGVVNFYHGFDQPKILDRQEMRLQFEHGEITLYEWIPVRMKLHALLSKKQLEKIGDLLVNFSIEHHYESLAESKKVRGRFSEITFDEHVTIEYGNASQKEIRYKEMLTAMITDQWSWITDRKHVRVIDGTNGVQSLKIAEAASRAAQNF